MTDTIVVGTDGSETAGRALAEAGRIAKALGAEVHIVTGYHNEHTRIPSAPVGAQKVWQPMPDSRAQSILDDAQSTLHFAGVETTIHAVECDAADALLRVAEDVGATMIVVGNRGMSGVRRALGSVPNTVSHRADCSVLIVQTRDPD